MIVPGRPGSAAGAALALILALAACGSGGGEREGPAVHSLASDVLRSTPFAGRLAVRRGCLVLLRGEAAFTTSPQLGGDSPAGADVPLFLKQVEHGTDAGGFFIVPPGSGVKLRIGDLVEGVGGPLWSDGESEEKRERLMREARPRMKEQCGDRLVQVRHLKPYNSPAVP